MKNSIKNNIVNKSSEDESCDGSERKEIIVAAESPSDALEHLKKVVCYM